jgi:hypothetical protein
MAREEQMWKQRARVQWLMEGDKNTRYFHIKASQRRQRNEIKGLFTTTGVWVTNKYDIQHTVVEYFEQMFTTSMPSHVQEGVRAIQLKVTRAMNDQLCRNFTAEEVHQALQQMHPTKAPGPDGMSAVFFQKYWAIVGKEVTEEVLQVLNTNASAAAYNKTNIALIPKTKTPQRMTEFRPISLCNVTYKLISKVIANRLKSVLSDLISETQSAFVPGRNITDNALVAFEIMHYFQQKRSGKDTYMALKLDMSKAYDRVEWVFIEQVMKKLGFCEKWISLIMNCITTVQYSVFVNGDTCGNIIPTRGLRQGDPLSPYLFLMCAEGFSSLLREAEDNHLIHGVSVCRGGPRVTHLFFADDSILFCKANNTDCQQLLNIFETYEKASGQKINMDKSSIHFSRNTSMPRQSEIKAKFAEMRDAHPNKYLGLPTIIGRSKSEVFKEIKVRLIRKLSGWKEKLLSYGGREILIKSVAQAIPTYAMSCFQLPQTLCTEMEGLIRKFWWGQRGDESKMSLVGWKTLCTSKLRGGMGFRDLHAFNMALLAKQGWRLLHNPNSMLYRLYKAKYFPTGNLFQAKIGHNPSYAWRSIWNAMKIVREGSRWRVGDGISINIWEDRWLPTPSTFKVITPQVDIGDTPQVSSLIDPITRRWRLERLHQFFLPMDITAIMSIPLGHIPTEDKRVWVGNNNGIFTVKSAYHIALNLQSSTTQEESSTGDPYRSLWKTIWHMKLPSKIRIFAWRTCKQGLPTMEILQRRGLNVNPSCPRCNEGAESISHAIWECSKIREIWRLGDFLDILPVQVSDVREIILILMEKGLIGQLEFFWMVAWNVWWDRNKRIQTKKNFRIIYN